VSVYPQASTRQAAVLAELSRHDAAAAALEALLGARAAPSERLSEAEEAEARAQLRRQREKLAARRAPPPDHFKLLGLDRGCTAEEVRMDTSKHWGFFSLKKWGVADGRARNALRGPRRVGDTVSRQTDRQADEHARGLRGFRESPLEK
jgi:hypothetical protein